MSNFSDKETIVALATARATSGVAIIRISGKQSLHIVQKLTKKKHFKPRFAYLCKIHQYANATPFINSDEEIVLDEVLVIYFQAPKSMTGEDIIEIQCHGSIPIIDHIIHLITLFPQTRLARAGEFSERAFINQKLDLVQAESLMSFIAAKSIKQAKAAYSNLSGLYSKEISIVSEKLTDLRVLVESSLDFSSEDIELIEYVELSKLLISLKYDIQNLYLKTKDNISINQDIKILILGLPNAGKSSLFNSVSGDDFAIVTPNEGTTRDLLYKTQNIDGCNFELIDTAGLRSSYDDIEKEGIKRALEMSANSDFILWVHNWHATPNKNDIYKDLIKYLDSDSLDKTIVVASQIDKIEVLSEPVETFIENDNGNLKIPMIMISSKREKDINCLKNYISNNILNRTSGTFSAHPRYLDSLSKTLSYIEDAIYKADNDILMELIAEDLIKARESIGAIVGELHNEELLGSIFSSFCIGK